jgi:hypothetical protein
MTSDTITRLQFPSKLMYPQIEDFKQNCGVSMFSGQVKQQFSASARISKGQGYQGFLRKRAGSSFGKKGQFASYKERNGQGQVLCHVSLLDIPMIKIWR